MLHWNGSSKQRKSRKYKIQAELLPAFNSVCKRDWTNEHFSTRLKKAEKSGIKTIVFHGNNGKKNAGKRTPIHDKLTIETKLINPTATVAKVHELVNSVLQSRGLPIIGSTTIKTILNAYKNDIYEALKGKVEANKRKAWLPQLEVLMPTTNG